MSQPIGPFTLTLGQTTPIDLGAGASARTVGTVVLYNLSGYEAVIQIGSVGSSGGWLVAHTADRYDMPSSWDGVIEATPQALASNAGNSPSFVIVGRVYAPGEAVTGTYPVALSRLANVGNSVGTVSQGTSAIQTGETPPNYLVRAAPVGYTNDTLDLIDTGEAHIRGLSSGTEVDFLNVIPNASNPATVQFHGVADSALAAPAAGITAGAIGAGVTIPGAQVTGSIPSTQAVDDTNAGSTSTPQLAASAANGLSVGAATAEHGQNVVPLIPTENNSASIGIGLGYTDAGGTFHLLATSDPGAALRYVPSGDLFRVSGFFSGSSAGTYTHNLNFTPQCVNVTCDVVNSTETVGADSYGSTTVHVNLGAGLAFKAESTG